MTETDYTTINSNCTNTDNKRHLFVTVFEHPAFYIMTLKSDHPDTAPVLTIKLCVVWQIPCFVVNLYCDTAPVLATNFVTGDKFAVPINLVPRYSYRPEKLQHDTKNRAMSSLHRDSFLAKDDRFLPVLSSASTNALYCRAVRCNQVAPNTIDKLITRQFVILRIVATFW